MDHDPRAEGLRFAEIVTGLTVADGPPPPGSPLAQLIAVQARADAEGLSEAWVRQEVREISREH